MNNTNTNLILIFILQLICCSCFLLLLIYNLLIAKTKKPCKFSIVGVTGLKFNGKDTVANHLCNKYGFTRIAFADPLKEICGILFGFNHEQLHGSLKETPDTDWFDLTPRKILQYIGTDMFRTYMTGLSIKFADEFWLLCARKKIQDILKKNPSARITISDVRFHNECLMVKRLGGIVIRVTRPTINNTKDLHESECQIPELDADYDIFNQGSIKELNVKIDDIVKQ